MGAAKPKPSKLSIEERNAILYVRTRPSIKSWYELQAEENNCKIVDVVEEIANLFKAGRIQILEAPRQGASSGVRV